MVSHTTHGSISVPASPHPKPLWTIDCIVPWLLLSWTASSAARKCLNARQQLFFYLCWGICIISLHYGMSDRSPHRLFLSVEHPPGWWSQGKLSPSPTVYINHYRKCLCVLLTLPCWTNLPYHDICWETRASGRNWAKYPVSITAQGGERFVPRSFS